MEPKNQKAVFDLDSERTVRRQAVINDLKAFFQPTNLAQLAQSALAFLKKQLIVVKAKWLIVRRQRRVLNQIETANAKAARTVFEHADPSEVKYFLPVKLANKLSKRQWLTVGAAAITVVALSVGGLLVTSDYASQNGVTTSKSTAVLGTASSAGSSTTANTCPGGDEKPKFKMIFPGGKSVNACRTSPPTSAPVFTYVDKIGNNSIKVNEQEMPEQVNDDSELSKFAADNYYKDSFNAGSTKVYLGKDSHNNQFMVFIKNRLLIFIQADIQEPQNVWVDYISSLR